MGLAIAAAVTLVVLSIWLIVGGVSQNTAPPAEPGPDNCGVCRRIWGWWDSLDFWGRVAGAAWYALQSLGCAIKGCRRP